MKTRVKRRKKTQCQRERKRQSGSKGVREHDTKSKQKMESF